MRPVHRVLALVSSLVGAAGLAAVPACGSKTPELSPFAELDPGPPVGAEPTVAPIVRNDFAAPVFAEGAPRTAPDVFAAPDVTAAPDGGSSAGPCLYEPEMGSLFPSNWLRPRFRFTHANAENLFELKLVVPNQTSPLVVYTTRSGYALDKSLWNVVTTTGTGTVHVTIRSAVVDEAGKLTAGPFKGTEGDVEIAPPQVQATGSVLYWTTSGGTVLKGFKVGDETVQPVIAPAAVGSKCVACHSSTPDGLYAGVTSSPNPDDGSSPSSVTIRSLDGQATEPPFLTAQAKGLLARPNQHAPVFSRAHWQAGDHTVLTMLPVGDKTEIVWTDLEATSDAKGTGWNVLSRVGDTQAASSAAFSHDGAKVAYVSTTATGAGVIASDGRIFTVPYGDRKGGEAKPLLGASDPAFNQFYPTFSADDRLVAFSRVPATPPTSASSYDNPRAEVFVVPAEGGTATRLAANDPPGCLTTKKSPGLTNSWPKWSPEVRTADGKSYYFLVFSSTRNPGSLGPQLYVAPIVVANGVVTTYAALYLWNQPESENNHTPAWDLFQLPGPK